MTYLLNFLLIFVTPNNLSARLYGSLVGVSIAALMLLLTMSYGAVIPMSTWIATLGAALFVACNWLPFFSIRYLYGGPYSWRDFVADMATETTAGCAVGVLAITPALLATKLLGF